MTSIFRVYLRGWIWIQNSGLNSLKAQRKFVQWTYLICGCCLPISDLSAYLQFTNYTGQHPLPACRVVVCFYIMLVMCVALIFDIVFIASTAEQSAWLCGGAAELVEGYVCMYYTYKYMHTFFYIQHMLTINNMSCFKF